MFLELRLRKIRLKEQNKLSEGVLYLYRDITAYIYNSDLSVREKEEVLQQIMDMLLEAEKNEKPVELVVGNDYEAFCKAIIEEYDNSKGIFYRLLIFIQQYLIWLSIMLIMFVLINVGVYHSAELKVDDLIFANVWALGFMPLNKIDKRKSLVNYMSQKTGIVYLIKNTFTYRKRILYALILPLVLILGIRYALISHYGKEMLNNYVDTSLIVRYLAINLLAAVVIEGIKRILVKLKY